MTLFFTLSGYLITSILMSELQSRRRVDLKAFYARRALRLLPALGVVILAAPAIAWAARSPQPGYLWKAAAAALYIGDISRALGGDLGLLNHTWSLAVEEQFYLVWPLVLIISFRRKAVVMSVAIATAVACLWRLSATPLIGDTWVHYAPDTQAFALLVGCFLAVAPLPAVGRKMNAFLLLSTFAALVVYSAWDFSPTVSGYLTTYGGVAVATMAGVLVHAARTTSSALLCEPAIRWFGGISYGLYLWHQVLLSIQPNGQELRGAWRLGAVALAVGVAWLSNRFVEQPFLRRKRKFERSSTRPEPSGRDDGRPDPMIDLARPAPTVGVRSAPE